jgi:hypothetical protein
MENQDVPVIEHILKIQPLLSTEPNAKKLEKIPEWHRV